MPTILIVEGNSPASVAAGFSGVAAFERSFSRMTFNLDCRVFAPYSNAPAEMEFADIDGIVFTGSGVTWAVDAPEAAPQRAAMKTALGTGLPIWGSCNGLQLAMVVMGGCVRASPNGKEVGTAQNIQLTEAGRSHPAMGGRADGFAVPCIHRDEVQHLPEGAILLAGNAHSPVQAAAMAKGGVDFWGVQYHPELALSDIAGFVDSEGNHDGFSDLAADLKAAETDGLAAARLGTTPQEMSAAPRARELSNWLAHVTARTEGTAGTGHNSSKIS